MTDAGAAREADCVVLIPYYESADGLRLAIESIRNVDGRIHILVVDDGSVATPAAVAIEDITSDIPIKVLSLPENRGIEHALNRGLEGAAHRYKYIARLDCGDECTVDRFERQLDRLDRDPELMLLGGAARFYNAANSYVHRNPQQPHEIRKAFRKNCPFIHPTVIFRSQAVDDYGFYPTDRPAAEDYAYFWKIAAGSHIENLPDVVVHVHVDPSGISSIRRKTQIRSRMTIMLDWFDGTPLATWGLLRSALLYWTPRTLSLRINAARGSR